MKVGFFDSGVGGTCILKAFQGLCPGVPTEYLADTKNCPYGNKSPEQIIALSRANTDALLRRGCGMIVVACNTATAAAIDTLRREYPHIPFVGIEPAVKPAALHSKSGVVAVLATQGTFNGRLYRETKDRFAKNVTVLATIADEFVTAVEAAVKPRTRKVDGRKLATAANRKMVRAKIEPLLAAGADHIVLGCTHFPHLKPLIEAVVAGRATIVDPSEAVARQIRKIYTTLKGNEK